MSRRSLPLNAIDAFLVTTRHLNLTHAAAELCLTQGAVSRKIASLEAWFGFPLFERHARGLRLSSQGCALLPELQSAFEHLLTVADQARSQQTVIRLKAPTCAMRWLVPRLLEVEREQPDLQIALTTTTDHNVNFKTESYDAAIVFGTHMSAGDLLFEEALTPRSLLIAVSLIRRTRDCAFTAEKPRRARKSPASGCAWRAAPSSPVLLHLIYAVKRSMPRCRRDAAAPRRRPALPRTRLTSAPDSCAPH